MKVPKKKQIFCLAGKDSRYRFFGGKKADAYCRENHGHPEAGTAGKK